MNKPFTPATGLRQRMIEDMNVRGFSAKTQHDYLRIVERFAAFLGRSPDLATPEDIRRFQVEQHEAGMPAPAMNSHISGLRFFFTTTIDRPDLSRKLLRVSYPRKLPMVLSQDEVARLLAATTCLKHRAALSVAYGAGLRVAAGSCAFSNARRSRSTPTLPKTTSAPSSRKEKSPAGPSATRAATRATSCWGLPKPA